MYRKSTQKDKTKNRKMMVANALGIIEKMRIEVYKKPNDINVHKTIFVQVNPESYTINHEVDFCEGQAIGAITNNLKFNKIKGEEVTFEFLFDSTGVLPPGKIVSGNSKDNFSDQIGSALKPTIVNPFEEQKTIEHELEEFKNLLVKYNSETHQPHFLTLLWGGYKLDCRLTKMSIKYKLFRSDGRAIRAIATCTFKGSQSYKLMEAIKSNQSPDVTHNKTFSSDDKFTLLSEKIYQSDLYYINAAKANKLLSFRTIKPEINLNFPPLKS